MSNAPRKNYDPRHDDSQDQDQDQKQDQLQAQANLQAQLQGQGQGQGQGQLQFAVQSLDSKSENENDNDNKNENSNENENKNENTVDNKLDNKVDNELDNKVDNSIDNKIDNSIENKVENTVETKVDVSVDIDLDLKADGLSSPVIDLHDFTAHGAIVMPDVVDQKMNDGNQFNIDQVNNLVDNDSNYSLASYYSAGSGGYGYPAAGFSMDAKIEGGESKVDSRIEDVAGTGVISSADAAINQSAFDQNITQGANIQFNSIEIQAAGDGITDSHDTL
jgi:hypothetical protein